MERLSLVRTRWTHSVFSAMSDRQKPKPKPEPKRRRVSREYESFMQEISEGVDLPPTAEMPIPLPGGGTSEQAEIIGDDHKTVRIWPDLADRIIEELR